MSEPGYEILSLDDPDRPLRRLGFRPFGVDCFTAGAAGGHLIPEDDGSDELEALYVVVRGRATFTSDGEQVDGAAGTLVHDPTGAGCEAVSAEPGTVVLAAFARPGETWRP